MSNQVSVVIPAFNAVSTIAETIASARQELVSQILVIDDASTDETAAVVAQLASEDSRITLIKNDRSGGPARARNRGLTAARGDFVLFLDSDDVLVESAVSRLLAAMTSEAVAVLGRFEAVDATGQPLDIGTWATVQLQPVVRRRGSLVPSSELNGESLLTRLVVPPPGGILIRTEVARSIGGYDESLGRSEDIAFLVALARNGSLALLHETVVRYRRDPKQRSQATAARRRGRQRALAQIIWSAPTRRERWALARGASAHHLDRAEVRWRAGRKGLRDSVVALRSVGLAIFFRTLGAISALR